MKLRKCEFLSSANKRAAHRGCSLHTMIAVHTGCIIRAACLTIQPLASFQAAFPARRRFFFHFLLYLISTRNSPPFDASFLLFFSPPFPFIYPLSLSLFIPSSNASFCFRLKKEGMKFHRIRLIRLRLRKRKEK